MKDVVNSERAPKSARPRRNPSASVRRKPASSPRKIAPDPRVDFSGEEWYEMVATAAYFRAEARGFENGSPENDWFEAEAELREQLAKAEDEADEKTEASLDLQEHEADAARGRPEASRSS
jgi:hypothetical protein